MLAQQMQRLDPVSRRQYGVTGMLERVDGRAAQLRLIFHDQHRLMPATRRHGHLFVRSEEHTSELQSRLHLVCRLLLEKKKRTKEHGEPSRLNHLSLR